MRGRKPATKVDSVSNHCPLAHEVSTMAKTTKRRAQIEATKTRPRKRSATSREAPVSTEDVPNTFTAGPITPPVSTSNLLATVSDSDSGVVCNEKPAAGPLLCDICKALPAAVLCNGHNQVFCRACDIRSHRMRENISHQRFLVVDIPPETSEVNSPNHSLHSAHQWSPPPQEGMLPAGESTVGVDHFLNIHCEAQDADTGRRSADRARVSQSIPKRRNRTSADLRGSNACIVDTFIPNLSDTSDSFEFFLETSAHHHDQDPLTHPNPAQPNPSIHLTSPEKPFKSDGHDRADRDVAVGTVLEPNTPKGPGSAGEENTEQMIRVHSNTSLLSSGPHTPTSPPLLTEKCDTRRDSWGQMGASSLASPALKGINSHSTSSNFKPASAADAINTHSGAKRKPTGSYSFLQPMFKRGRDVPVAVSPTVVKSVERCSSGELRRESSGNENVLNAERSRLGLAAGACFQDLDEVAPTAMLVSFDCDDL